MDSGGLYAKLKEMKADDVTLDDAEKISCLTSATPSKLVSIDKRSVSSLFTTLSCASGSALKRLT
jgi:hypothetical protein